MSKLRKILGKKTWIGLVVIFLTSLAINAICSLLLIKGVLQETSVNGCVYAAWGIGGLLGTCVAVHGKDGALLRGILLTVFSFGLAWLLGFLIFNTTNLDGYGCGVAISIGAGCLGGSLLGSGKKQKRNRAAGKRKASYRGKQKIHSKNERK